MINTEEIRPKVDQIFAEWDHTATPGCALAVVKDGSILYTRGYGMANLEYGVPIRPDTVFHIASVSKHFAALAVTLLAHEGKLTLDDEVRQHVPELPDFGEKITIRHLIHHTSGLRDQWELLIAAGWRMDDVITMDDILELVSKQRELNFKPGDNHIYCNTGYTLLSFIVQRVSGMSMRAFCEERMFKPLGMKNTHFHDDHTMIVPNRAYSYTPTGYRQYKNAVLSYANVGATSLFTTVEDMALWDEEFYQGRVFGPAVIAEMHTPGVLNSGEQLKYAHGLLLGQHRGLRTVEHSGGDAGYRTHLLRFPEQHFSVIVFSNLGTVNPMMLSKKVAEVYLGDQMQPDPDLVDAIELPQEKLETFTGQYFCRADGTLFRIVLRDGRLVESDNMQLTLEAITEDKLRIKDMPMITLTRQEPSKSLQLEVGGYGKPSILEKVDAAGVDEAGLLAYTGDYTSPELEVTYRLVVKDGQLALQRRKYGTLLLKPAIQDGFSSDFFSVFFDRENGEVTSLRVYSGRMHGVRFVRQTSAA